MSDFPEITPEHAAAVKALRPKMAVLARYLTNEEGDSEDLVDDAVLTYYRHFTQGEGTIETKLTQALRHRVADKWRRDTWWNTMFVSLGTVPEDTLVDTDEDLRNLRLDVQAALAKLPQPMRVLLEEVAIERYSLREVAERYNLSHEWVRKVVLRAGKTMRELLSEYK